MKFLLSKKSISVFSIFRKSTPLDLSFLKTDMHSHLVPGIDDGAKSLDDSLQMIRKLSDLGYRKLITTPHTMAEYYPNTSDIIRDGIKKVQAAVKAKGINLSIEAASEYFLDEDFKSRLEAEKELLTFSGNHILIEFSTFSAPNEYQETIFKLNTTGYRPILAHPERYVYWINEFEHFEKIKSVGCQLQVNLLSLAGHYGPEQKKLGIRLLKAGLVDYLGTDLHRVGHISKIASITDRKVKKLLEGQEFKNGGL